jgi:hypothetical protein
MKILLVSAFSHSKKFTHGATIVSGTCWRREPVLRQQRSRRGGTLLLCMSSLRTSTEETATTSSDSQFSNYKPSTAFLFPGQVKQTTATNKNVCLHRPMCNGDANNVAKIVLLLLAGCTSCWYGEGCSHSTCCSSLCHS